MEAGLTDPVEHINMAGTAEVCAQIYGIDRAEEDEYARESFRRAIEGWNSGFYDSHVVPVSRNGAVVLEKDEYPVPARGPRGEAADVRQGAGGVRQLALTLSRTSTPTTAGTSPASPTRTG